MHLVAVWLVFKIARRLAGESTSALLAAALFALTPVHVAAVVWMAASCYVLGAALGLAAFYLILPREDGTAAQLGWLRSRSTHARCCATRA